MEVIIKLKNGREIRFKVVQKEPISSDWLKGMMEWFVKECK